MRRGIIWTALLGLGLTAAAAPAQNDEPKDEQRPERATKVPTDGFWPTKMMIERAVDRITEEMVDEYNFDEEQLAQTRTIIKERLPRFMNENKAEIKTLMNQYFEALLNDEAPEIDHVAKWAERVQPLVRQFQGVLTEVTEDMREIMTEDQQALLDGHAAAMNVGLKFIDNRMQIWADGGYDAETEWIRSPQARRVSRERERELEHAMDSARHEAMGYDPLPPYEPDPEHVVRLSAQQPAPAPSPEAPRPDDEWGRYVRKFIQRYQLNPDQQSKAQARLAVKRRERESYLRKKGAALERITQLFKNAKESSDPEDLERAEAEYAKLQKPVERMFTQLKEKLSKLPTREQRRKALEADSAAKAPTTKPTPRAP